MKIKVKLKCQHDNGKVVLQPGTETEMERDLAMSLFNMGMVEIVAKESPARQVKPSSAAKSGTKTSKGDKAELPDFAEADNENVDRADDSGDPDNELPDPDSLTE